MQMYWFPCRHIPDKLDRLQTCLLLSVSTWPEQKLPEMLDGFYPNLTEQSFKNTMKAIGVLGQINPSYEIIILILHSWHYVWPGHKIGLNQGWVRVRSTIWKGLKSYLFHFHDQNGVKYIFFSGGGGLFSQCPKINLTHSHLYFHNILCTIPAYIPRNIK